MYRQWLADVKATERQYGSLEDSRGDSLYIPGKGHTHAKARDPVRPASRASTLAGASTAVTTVNSDYTQSVGARAASRGPLGASASAISIGLHGTGGSDGGADVAGSPLHTPESGTRKRGRSRRLSRTRSALHQKNHLLDDLRQVSQHKLAPIASLRGTSPEARSLDVETCTAVETLLRQCAA